LIDHCIHLTIVVINLILFNMPLLTWYFLLILICFISYTNNLFFYHSDFEIFLKLVNFPAIILFSLDKSILSSFNIILNLIIFIINFLLFLNNRSEALIPITGLWIIIKFFKFMRISFFLLIPLKRFIFWWFSPSYCRSNLKCSLLFWCRIWTLLCLLK